MPWWSWIILGVVMLGAELMGVDAAFYLMFLGIAAVLTGLVGLSGIVLEPWAQWLAFAGLSLVSMVLFRKRLYSKMRGGVAGYSDSVAGDTLLLEQTLQPGESCRIAYRGTSWTILNDSPGVVEKGTTIKVKRIEGLTLIIE